MSNSLLEEQKPFPVLPLPGLHLDSLGLCLSALGLLSLCTRRWASVRGGWRSGFFYLAGGPELESQLLEYLADIGERGEWTNYDKGWANQQKADTKGKTAANTTRWRAREAKEEMLPMLQSHISTSTRLAFNPLFGTGGNAGKRDFATGWEKATSAIKKTPKGWKRDSLNADLAAFLRGEPGICLADYNAACWFSAANKAFNSGTARPFRDGQVSPWGMALACEAFGLFQGGVSRRLGIATRAAGAFPFITGGTAPSAAGEAGKNLGELWLPIWEQPMSLPEIAAIFQRGKAEVNGRGAATPIAFAAAIFQRGVDAGIREFRRFVLLRTTSENTFESRLSSIIAVRGRTERATAAALSQIVAFRDSLPADRKNGTRWIYTGLRGPLDEALVAFAERPAPESARTVVDAMITSLRSADRNRSHRRNKSAIPPRTPIRLQQLPGAWAASLLEADGLDACAETRIGLALATLFPGKHLGKNAEEVACFLPYWLGVQMKGSICIMPEEVPFRRVWSAGTLVANLAAVLHRRLVEAKSVYEPPFSARYCISLSDIEIWLSGAVNDAEVERWTMRFSLFNWTKESVAAVASRLGDASEPDAQSGQLALFALFKPLFQATLINALISVSTKPEVGSFRAASETAKTAEKKLTPQLAKVGPLRGIVAQLARGNVSAAVELARNAYRAVGIEPAKLRSLDFACPSPDRLLAALLIPAKIDDLIEHKSRTGLSQRWLSPKKQKL